MKKEQKFFKKISSGRFGKIVLILLAAVLMFGGPTYLLYVSRRVIPFPFLELLGVILFIIGLYIFLRVYEEKEK